MAEVENSTVFNYTCRVAFHDTDTMGVVHHSNYIKYFEEARVAWLRDRGLVQLHRPLGPYSFAVIELDCRYIRPAQFEDELVTRVEGIVKGLRLTFRYAIWNKRAEEWIATGTTVLVPLDENLKPARLPEKVRSSFKDGSAGFHGEWPPAPPSKSPPKSPPKSPKD